MNLADGAEFIEPGDVERLRNVDNLSVQVEKQAVELEDWIAALELEPFGDDLGGGNGGKNRFGMRNRDGLLLNEKVEDRTVKIDAFGIARLREDGRWDGIDEVSDRSFADTDRSGNGLDERGRGKTEFRG